MCFHPMGEAVFWLKSLYQLGFVCFFDFYFWIRDSHENTCILVVIWLFVCLFNNTKAPWAVDLFK
ncbi:hypothetical protein BAZOLSSOX_1167 [uncultured Gammaproteobacteria bacterium]|nr:hypothetical protein BAZOLSSOX_1167 [uncultured Gammaproteobacteria bacterium]